ncbi:PAS domain-containing protein (plasmid) [Skermanella rosea]|uniref:PAS domain-containing sensor histidine kinase n=1 Tax=Skermanella rosea TaxID=1817965 RepID=UPI0019349457|nr:ATP-binding protein [Skermanella rosea]UEM06897.1 PAS domain-containing protein [Skermanella rosea]
MPGPDAPGIVAALAPDLAGNVVLRPVGALPMTVRPGGSFPILALGTVRYPLLVVDRDGRVEAASRAAGDLLDVPAEAVQGLYLREIDGPAALLHDAVASATGSGRPAELEIRARGRRFDIVVEPLRADAGAVSGAVIHASETPGVSPDGDMLSLVLDQLPCAVYWKDSRSRYLGGNRLFAEVVGLGSSRAVPGITDDDIMASVDAETVRREDEQVMRTGESLVSIEQELALAVGGRSIEKLKVPLRGADGGIIGILCIAQDVTQRKRAEEKLITDKLAAEQASRAKTSFLAAASHDLRQPIQALALFAKLLEKRVSEPASRNLVGLIQQSARSLSDLLEAVIHLSKLEAGEVEPNIGPTLVGELIGRLVGEFSHQAVGKGLDFRAVNTDMEVQSDPLLLERILRNLISNAIRYTERGRVLVGCRRRGDRVSIEVWDTGIGIPKDQFGEIFREFHRSRNKNHKAVDGFGIGLAVVDRLTNLLGHSIEVSSIPGKGSVFRIQAEAAPSCLFHKSPVEVLPIQGKHTDA